MQASLAIALIPSLSPEQVFGLATPLALVGWLCLIFVPRRFSWRRRIAACVAPTLLSCVYVGLIFAWWSRRDGGFESLERVTQLFSSPWLLIAGWFHFLAFDLLIGCDIDRRAERAGISRWALIPAFLLTFLFGPAGWLVYMVQEYVKARRQTTADKAPGAPHDGGDEDSDDLPHAPARLARWMLTSADPALLRNAIVMGALVVPTTIAAAIDDRLLNGVNIWIKPLKFQISLAVFLATLALIAPLAGSSMKRGWGRIWAWTAIIASWYEIAWICLQAGRGVGSHFNLSTPLDAGMYQVAGVGAVLLVVVSIALAVLVLRAGDTRPPLSLRLGIGFGNVAGVLAGGVVGLMLSFRESHFIGGIASDAAGLPFFGWSMTGGDLRVAHFIGLHGLQVFLLLGLALVAVPRRPAIIILSVAGLLWLALTCLTASLALRGLPVFPG